LAIVSLILAYRASAAVEYWLCADWTVKSLSEEDGDIVWIWGFAQSEPGFADDCEGEVTSPGPMLTIPEGDDSLIVHLDNRLPYIQGEPVAVSIVIPGVPSDSDTVAALPDEPSIYTWKGLEPGTYIYRSGVHPDIQVPMGLYGGIKIDSEPGYAYPDYPYDQETVLYYSEIDPTLNWIVLFGGYDPGSGKIGHYEYNPRYVLVNGEPFQYLSGFPAAGVGETILLRFLNVGTTTYLPVILWSYMDVIAENAEPYPVPARRYALSVEPGSTKDALFTNDPVGLLEFLDALFGPDEKDTPIDDVYTFR
jgi:FtsP/CotA-like multicopper oxidase with cupredoxin domain